MSTSEDRSGLINLFDKLQPLAFGLAYSRNVVKVRDRLLQRPAVEVGHGALLRYPRNPDLPPSAFVIAGEYLYVQLRPQVKSADVEFRVDIVNRDEYKYSVYFSTVVSSVLLQPPLAATLPLPPLSPDTWYTVAIDLPAALHIVSRGRDGAGSYGWVCGVQLGPAALYRGIFHAAAAKAQAAHTPVTGPHHTWPAVLRLTGYAADAPVLLWCPAAPKTTGDSGVVGTGRSRTAADDALTSRAHGIAATLPHVQQLRVRPSSAKSLASSGSGLSEEAKHSARARSPYSQGNSPKHHENAAVAAARHRDLELANMAVAVRSIREGSFSGTIPTSPARSSARPASSRDSLVFAEQPLHIEQQRVQQAGTPEVPAVTMRVSSEEEPGAGSALLAARAAAMQADDIWAVAGGGELEGGVGEGAEGEEQAAEKQAQEDGLAESQDDNGEEHATTHENRTAHQSTRSEHEQDGSLPDLQDKLASLRAHTQVGTGTGAGAGVQLKIDRTTGLALQAVARVGGASPVVWIPSSWDPLLQCMRPAQLLYPVDCTLCGLDVQVQDNERGVPCGPPYSGAQAYYPGSPHTGPISSIVASPCTSLLATASIAPGAKRTSPDPHAVTVCIWDRARRVVLATLTSETHGLADGLQPPAWASASHSSPALSLSFSLDSTLLACSGRDEKGRACVTVLDVAQLVRDTQERQRAGEARGGDTSALDITLASTAGTHAQAGDRPPHARGGPGLTRAWVPSKQEGGPGLYPLFPVQATLPCGALIVARQVVEGSSSSHLLKCAFSPYSPRALWTLSDGGGGNGGAAALHVWTVQAGRMLGKAIPLDRALVSAGVLFTDFSFEPVLQGAAVGAVPGGVLDMHTMRGRSEEEDAPALASTGAILPAPQPQAELAAESSPEPSSMASEGGTAGPRVYISTSGGTLIQLGYDRREVQGVHVLHDGCIAGVSVGARHVCTVGWEDGLVRVWPSYSSSSSSRTQGFGTFIMEAAHEGRAIAVAVSPSERLVAVLSSTRGPGGREEAAVASLGVLDVAAQRYKVVARGCEGSILAVYARPPPAVLPGEDSGNAVDLYDQLQALHGTTLPVVTLASDRTIRVWHVDSTPSSTRGAWKQAYHFHTGELEASCVVYHPMLGHSNRVLACRELLYLSKAAGKRARQQVPGTVEASMMQEIAETAEREYQEGLHAALDACNTLFLGFTDGSVRVLHVPSQALHASFTTAHAGGARVTHLACSEDGQYAFSAALDGVLAQYTSSLSPMRSGGGAVGDEAGPLGTARRGHTWALARTFSWGLPRGVYATAVSLALESSSGLVAFSCASGGEEGLPPGSLCAVLSARTLAPLGRGVLPLVEAQAKHKPVRTWDKASGRAVKVHPSPYALSMGEATCIALLPVAHADRRQPGGVREVLLAAGASEGQLFMWAVGQERCLQASRQSHSWRPSFDPAQASFPEGAGWDLLLLLSVQLHAAAVTSMQFVPASGLLVTTGGGSERMLRCWDAHALCEHALLQGQLQQACAQAEEEGELHAAIDLLEACQAVQHTPLASRASQGGASTARRRGGGFCTLACIPLCSPPHAPSSPPPAGATTMYGPAEERRRNADSTLLLTAQAGASSWFSLLL